jgi:dihydroxyacetone kinase-like protein
MVTELSLDRASAWMRQFAAEIAAQKEHLTQLDAAIGDADHGINMDRGFTAVCAALDAEQPADLGALFTLVGRTLISTVGGASGPLYGTAFLRLGSALAGKAAADVGDLAAALAQAYDGIAARGRSARGEKTMLDAFGPAVDAFQAGGESSLPELALAAAAAAEDGARGTMPLRALRGRASFLGEYSIGHKDPGAASTSLLFRALATAMAG